MPNNTLQVLRYGEQERIGNFARSGKYNNMEYLILDYKNFRTLSIVSGSNKIDLVVDDQIIKTHEMDNDFGEIKGIHMFFKGSPYIDFVRLSDSTGNMVYNDEFN